MLNECPVQTEDLLRGQVDMFDVYFPVQLMRGYKISHRVATT